MTNEIIWTGKFGDDYTERNKTFPYEKRRDFFQNLVRANELKSVLEVGCNWGQNLALIAPYLPSPWRAWGVDINDSALLYGKQRNPKLQLCKASGFNLPFKDESFDLVFTAGVLIHQKPDEIDSFMQEIIRVARKYVLAIEYAGEVFEEIPYRGEDEALFKGPYGQVYEKRYGLRLLSDGFLGPESGFDNTTMWLLGKK